MFLLYTLAIYLFFSSSFSEILIPLPILQYPQEQNRYQVSVRYASTPDPISNSTNIQISFTINNPREFLENYVSDGIIYWSLISQYQNLLQVNYDTLNPQWHLDTYENDLIFVSDERAGLTSIDFTILESLNKDEISPLSLMLLFKNSTTDGAFYSIPIQKLPNSLDSTSTLVSPTATTDSSTPTPNEPSSTPTPQPEDNRSSEPLSRSPKDYNHDNTLNPYGIELVGPFNSLWIFGAISVTGILSYLYGTFCRYKLKLKYINKNK
ncbi:hypothetical protein BB559_004585 [Furculomyces boomerangus]|uniref:Protein PBN1 n=1 Tax=Furculomyces boomerangus TaxID=61424 RepID=A0A2T9YDV0_9FUNG|nr:hypothetical protein BB559_004734 [Furculomyces boomerangus]PVU90528.1 hypothetical protein BB559_004585 [Furculomyces boomerangus]